MGTDANVEMGWFANTEAIVGPQVSLVGHTTRQADNLAKRRAGENLGLAAQMDLACANHVGPNTTPSGEAGQNILAQWKVVSRNPELQL